MTIYRSDPAAIGRGYAVEFAFDDGELLAFWSPDVPPPHERPALVPAYRSARAAFLGTMAARGGPRVAMLEIGEARP